MNKWRGVLIIISLAFAIFFIWQDWQKYFEKKFEIDFLNIGQGDSALIKFRNGETMLVDCGPDNSVLARLGEHLSFFTRTLDYLVVTHPDLDHYGGCVGVLKRYKVKNIIQNGDESKSDPYYQEWVRVVAQENAQLFTIAKSDKLNIASTTITWLSPDPEVVVEKPDANNRSIVFKLTDIFGVSALFTGDAEIPLETALIKKYCTEISNCLTLKSDYLKIGHHGSDSSSGADWLTAVSPKTAIISVGKNKFGHPSLRVLRHLQRAGVEILRTDQVGNIVINAGI